MPSRFPLLLFLLLASCSFGSAQETIYMAVLGSHNQRLNAADNPLVGLFVSTDRGASWKHLGWREYIRTFYCEAGPDGTLWSACGNGALRSTDRGASWKITTGWEITEVLKVRVDPSNPSTVYAATAYGVFKSSDAGASWQKKTAGFSRKFVADVWVDRADRGTCLPPASRECTPATTPVNTGSPPASRTGRPRSSARIPGTSACSGEERRTTACTCRATAASPGKSALQE